jgi:REP-associated tyrosine transposase
MSHTYSSNRVHVIFSTKDRRKSLSAETQAKLWAYLKGIAKNQGFELIVAGGVEDHVHMLLVLPPKLPLARAVQLLKGNSSKWLNDNGIEIRNFAWQEGYGAFSVSASQTDAVVEYIKDQAEHHRKRTFEEEFLSMLKRYGVQYDPEYVLG